MKDLDTRGGRLRYEESGSGVPLVLLHANGHDHHDFDAVVPALAQRFRTIALDWPGFGESPPLDPPDSASAPRFADLLAAAVDALRLGPACFIGNSVGGFAAARLAIDRPAAVRALILVDSGGFTPMTLAARLVCRVKGSERFTRLMNRRFAGFYLKRRTSLVEEMLARIDAGRRIPSGVATDAALWRNFPRPGNDLRADAARIACPVLLAWGAHDPVSRAGVEAKLAAACIPGARLALLDTGHAPFAEAPEAFLAEALPFLEEACPHERGGVASYR